MENSEPRKWFLLNFIPTSRARNAASPQAWIERFNTAEKARLEVFAPRFTAVKDVKGKRQRADAPLIYHYAFVGGELADIKKLCSLDNGFSFVLNRGSSQRYASVSEDEIREFKRIARFYANELPIYEVAEISLEEGDKVEVVDGEFAGLEGFFIPYPRSKSGNLCLNVTQNLATVVFNINTSSVRVLQFAPGSKRIYDRIDAILPKLFSALRKYSRQIPINDKEFIELDLFVRRLGIAQTGKGKTEAKLSGILATICHLLGNSSGESIAKKRYESLKSNITSKETQALMLLLEGAVSGNLNKIITGAGLAGKDSRLQEEFNYYLDNGLK